MLGGRRRNVLAEAERLYELNSEAITVARDHGMLIRAGFVVGHIGTTRALLTENLKRILALITEGGKHGVFSAIDADVLSPQPGATTPTSPPPTPPAVRREARPHGCCRRHPRCGLGPPAGRTRTW